MKHPKNPYKFDEFQDFSEKTYKMLKSLAVVLLGVILALFIIRMI